MNNINIEDIKIANCYDYILLVLIKYYNYPCELYYLNLFYTQYITESSSKLSEMLTRNCPVESTVFIQKQYGVNIKYKDDIKEIKNQDIKKNIEIGHWFCIWIDAYYCRWTKFYEKQHWGHMCLILDRDNGLNQYLCIDVFYNEVGYINISYSDFEKYSKGYSEIVFNEPLELSSSHIIKILKNDILVSNERQIYEDYIKRIERISKSLNNEINEIVNIDSSMLLIKLKWISADKKLFSNGLKYIEFETGIRINDKIYLLLSVAEEKWMNLHNYVIKSILTKNIAINKVVNIFSDIYKLDVETNRLLQDVVKG